MISNQKTYQQHLWIIQTARAGSFHVKWTKAGHDSSQILIKLFQIKGKYEIRLSWKFQHNWELVHVMTPQSCHGKLNIDKTRGGLAALVHFWISITFFVHNLKFWNLLHCCCTQKTLKIRFWSFLRIHNGMVWIRKKEWKSCRMKSG